MQLVSLPFIMKVKDSSPSKFSFLLLGFSQNPDVLQKVLEFAISLEVPPQDSIGENVEIIVIVVIFKSYKFSLFLQSHFGLGSFQPVWLPTSLEFFLQQHPKDLKEVCWWSIPDGQAPESSHGELFFDGGLAGD